MGFFFLQVDVVGAAENIIVTVCVVRQGEKKWIAILNKEIEK